MNNAEDIAVGLDARQVGDHNWIAKCPAHDDRNPSFSITQKGDQVLFYCFAGCRQSEVIDALRSRGLWPEPKAPAEVHTLVDKDAMRAFCRAHENDLSRDV